MFKKVLILIPLILLIVGTLFYNIKVNSLNSEILEWQNEAARLDTISTYYKSVSEKLSLQVDEIRSENKKLNRLLEKKDETITSQVVIIGVLRDSLLNVSTTDTIIIVEGHTDTLSAKSFNAIKHPFSLSGYFYIVPPYTISFNNISASIDLEVNIVEGRNKTYKTYVDTHNPNFIIKDITTKVVPYSPTFWERVDLELGAMCNSDFISIHSTLFYSKYGVSIGASNKGFLFGASYRVF